MDLREKAVCKQSCSCANEETLDAETLNKCFIVSCFLDASKQGKVFLKNFSYSIFSFEFGKKFASTKNVACAKTGKCFRKY